MTERNMSALRFTEDEYKHAGELLGRRGIKRGEIAFTGIGKTFAYTKADW